MPVKYTIKRNSLSSKWGVWVTNTDADSPVENLAVELKSNEDAEAYCTRIQAGEPHDAIVDSLSNKKRGSGGGGMFGKLFGKGKSETAAPEPHAAPVSNPVIEIEASSQKEAAPQEPVAPVAEPAPVATPVAETPSHFQLIEPPAAPPQLQVQPEPALAPEPVAEVEPAAEVAPVPEVVDEPAQPVQPEVAPVAETEALVEQAPAPVEQPVVQQQPAPQPVVAEEPVAEAPPAPEPQQPPAPAVEPQHTVSSAPAPAPEPPVVTPQPQYQAPTPQPQASAPSQDAGRDDGLIVDWTFTPPPDVTPEELKAAGGIVPEQAEAEARHAVDPEWQAAGSNGAAPSNSTVSNGAKPAPAPAAQQQSSDRLVIDVCVSQTIRDSSNGDPDISDKKYNSIASKEYTEVSKAFSAGSQDNLREELTHLAAVCLAWADAIEKRQTDRKGTRAA